MKKCKEETYFKWKVMHELYLNDDKTHVDLEPHNGILWGLKAHCGMHKKGSCISFSRAKAHRYNSPTHSLIFQGLGFQANWFRLVGLFDSYLRGFHKKNEKRSQFAINKHLWKNSLFEMRKCSFFKILKLLWRLLKKCQSNWEIYLNLCHLQSYTNQVL